MYDPSMTAVLSPSDRRTRMWDRFGKLALKNFKVVGNPEKDVLFLVDVEDKLGESLLRICYMSCPNANRTGRVLDNVDEELARLRSADKPALLVLSLPAAHALVDKSSPKVGNRLDENPGPNCVRVVLVSGGLALMHDVLPEMSLS